MSGTWDDDGEIKSVKVSIVNTSTQAVLDTIDADFSIEKKTWSCTINPNAETTRMLDGSYDTTVSIKDTYDHETKASVAFKIDNTPPFVILTRPATKEGAANPDAYGCEFNLEGEAVDDNTISLVEVEVYDSITNELKTTISLQNVAKKIDRTVATFGNIEYEQIFGKVEKDENGNYIFDNVNSKNFYCKVVAYDDARKVPAEEGDKGNKTSEFYLLSEISKYISDYKSLGFYQIINNTYELDSSAKHTYTVGDIKEVVEKKKLEKATFSLDPRNNPTYKVSSCMTLEDLAYDLSLKQAELTDNSTVEVSLIAGLDEYYITKDTVGIYLVECDVKGTRKADAEKIVLFPKYKDKDGNVTTEDRGGKEWTDAEVKERDDKFGVSGSTYTVSVKIGKKTNSALTVGKYYAFLVEGYDEKNNSIYNYGGTNYAIKLKSENATPKLSIDKIQRKDENGEWQDTGSVSKVELKEGEPFKLYGTAKLQDDDEVSVRLSFAVPAKLVTALNPEETIEIATISGTDFETLGIEIGGKDETNEIAPHKIPDRLKDTEFQIKIEAINPGETNEISEKEVSVNYDCYGPKIDEPSVSPLLEVEGKTEKFVNGVVTLKSSAEDSMNTIASIEYDVTGTLIDATEKSTSEKIDIKDTIGKGFTVDTTLYKDESDITVTIYAADKNGNESKIEKELHIDQSTDKPVIVFNNADPEIKTIKNINDKTAINEINNIFGIQSNNKLSASISDDDGVKKVTVHKIDENGNDEAKPLLENGKSTNYTLTYTISNVQGSFKIYIEVEDTLGKTAFSKLTTDEFLVAIDEGAPNFSITSANNALQAQNAAIDVTGTVSDGTPVTIKRYKYVEATSFEAGEKYFKKSGSTYTEQIGLASLAGGDYYKRIVENESITVDTKNDVDNLTEPEKKKIIIVKDTSSWSDIIPAEEVGIVGDVLYYEAMDDFGQTTGQTYIYSIDSYPPLFKIKKVDSEFDSALEGAVAEGNRKEVFVKAGKDKYLQISGSVEDRYSNDDTKSRGLDDFVYYKLTRKAISVTSKEDIKDWSTTKKIDSGSWSQAIDLGDIKLTEDGVPNDGVPYILYIVAKDAAGNVSSADENPFSAVYVISDNTLPTVTITSIKLGDADKTSEDNIQITGDDTAKNIVIKATIKDPLPEKASPTAPDPTKVSGINSVKLLLDGNEYKYNDGEEYKTATITNSGDEYTITFPASGLASGTFNFKISAVDKVGNSKDADVIPISKDTNPPTATIFGVSPAVVDDEDNTVYNGKIKVKISASDDVELEKIDWWIENSSGAKVEKPFDPDSTDTEITKSSEISCSGKASHNATICIDTDYFEKNAGDYVFKIQITDKAGNKSTEAEEDLKIDQTTDQPVITLTNANAAINTLTLMNDASEGGDTNNIFDTTDNKTLKFSVTDDDGIKSVSVKYNVNNVNGNNDVTTNTIYSETVKYPATTGQTSKADGYPKSKRFDYTLPSKKNLYDVQIEVVDCKGETTSYKSNTLGKFLVAIDDGAPSLDVTLPSEVAEKNSKHYVNSSFDATVKTKDDYALESVTVTNGALKEGTLVKDATEQTLTFTVSPTATGTTEEKEIQFAAVDKFGQKNTDTYTVVFDFGSPTLTPTYSSPSSTTDWYNKTGANVTITPKAADNKVLEGVYWATFDEQQSDTGLDAVADNTWTTVTGAATNSAATSGVTFGDGTTYLYIKAKDLAGNVTYSGPYVRNIDTEKPEITALTSPTSELLVNGSNDISVDVSVKDNGGAGISKVEIHKATKDGDLLATTETVNGTDQLTLGEADSGVHAVEGKISSGKIEATKKGIFAVCFVVYDAAGNTTTETVEIKIDKENPAVEFTSHSDEDIVNKTIELKGTAKDNQSLKSLKLEIAVLSDDGKNWSAASELFNIETDDTKQKVLDGNVWTYELDTNPLNSSDEPTNVYNGKKIKLSLTAVDKAENTSDCSIELNVDQNTDRPIITLDLDKNDAIINKESFNVSVDDDDAISGLELKIAKGDTKPKKAKIDEGDVIWNDIAPIDLSNGSGKYTNTDEATTKLWFYVSDAAGGVFETAIDEDDATKLYDVPYIKFTNKGDKADNTSEISYTYDNTKPTVKTVGFGFGDDADAASTGAQAGSVDNYSAWVDNDTHKLKFGGTKKRYISLAVTPNDTNGIKSVTGTGITGQDLTFTKVSPDASRKGNCVWYSNAIDLESVSDSTISVTVTDNSGLTQEATLNYSFSVDNEGPSLTMTSPQSTETKTAPIDVKGTCSDTSSSIGTFKYLVLNNPYYSESKKPVSDATIIEYFTGTTLPDGGNEIISIDDPVPSASFEFSLSDLPTTTAALDAYSNVSHTNQNVYTMLIYFYLEDDLGNYTLVKESFSYDPFGNRPSAEVNYPTGPRESYGEVSRTTVNGTVRLSGSAAKGSADDAKTPAAVYVQFDVNNDGSFDAADLTLLQATNGDYQSGGDLMYDIVEGESGLKTDLGLDNAASVDDQALEGASFWGVKVKGSPSSWFLTLNSNMEFQNSNTDISTLGKEFLVGAKAVAVVKDTENQKAIFGYWSDAQFFLIDTNIPVLGEKLEQVVEYDKEGAVASTRTYQQDMYLKGKSSLQLSVAAEPLDGNNDITKVKYYTAPTKAGLNDSGSATKNEVDLTTSATETTYSDGKIGYDVTIPLSENDEASGSLWVKVEAFKSNEASAYTIYNVNFDNAAPKINNLKFNSVVHKSADADTRLIVNSNGKFTLGGQVEDDASGYERVGFYVVRGDGTTYEQRMYDPMNSNKKISIRNASSGAASIPKVTEKEEGVDSAALGSSAQKMYGATQDVTVSADGTKLTLATEDAYIRSGGVVCIAGTYIKMTSVSEKTVTLETATTAKDSVSAFFPYMQFVDNTGAEKTDEDGLTVKSGDDGDGMPESIIKSQSKYDWDATLQSQNIPDGPCKVVIFAWDKAGNISAASYEASIQNNAPRLVKLHLGTDLNGNGTYSDSEFVSYDVLGEVGKQSSYKNMQTYAYKGKSFRVKDNLAVAPEFVGGNGVDYSEADVAAYEGIKMVALTAAGSDQTINTINKTGVVTVGENKLISSDTTKFDEGSTMVANRGYTTVENVSKRNNIWLYEIPSAAFGGDDGESSATELASGKGERAVSFTFWDTTEDTTQGENSSYCHLCITDLIVDVIDTDEPTIQIDPFYWNSVDDASMVYDADGNPLGHIDLGATPQVSGRVYIRGTAYDNTKHGDIYIKAPDGVTKKVAHYDGTWEYETGLPDNWKEFKVTYDGGVTQDGHEIEWQFEIDMTPYGVANGQEVNVFAIDAQGNNKDYYTEVKDTTNDELDVEATATATATKLAAKDVSDIDSTQEDVVNNKGVVTEVRRTSRYVMDFVPYIKSVSDKTRSRLGRYPVRAGEEIKIEGMNFAAGSHYIVKFYKTGSDKKQATDANSWTADTTWSGEIAAPGGSITIKAPEYSCFVEVSVTKKEAKADNLGKFGDSDYMQTPNNSNDNAVGYNIQKGKFRKNTTTKKMYAIDDQPGDDFWTDDCYLSVWNVETDFEGSIKPRSGTMKKVTTDDLYKKVSGSSVDKKSNMQNATYVAWSSDDLQIYGTSPGNFSKTYSMGEKQATYTVPIEALDFVLIEGMPWYVGVDNYVGNSSANVWGVGLYLGQEGIVFNKEFYNGTNTVNDGESKNIIEKLGASTAADSRSSSDGYDSVLNQFINPRMAGYHNASETINDGASTHTGVDYIYISYYDSYARCLKYAAYKGSHRQYTSLYTPGSGQQWGNDNGHKDLIPLMRSAGGNMTNGKSVVAGYDTTFSNPTSFAEEAGEWSDIVIDPYDKFPVIVYYNKKNGSLEVAYGKSAAPESGNVTTENGGTGTGDKTGNGWLKKKSIRPSGTSDFGRYCSTTVDSSGSLHIAAQDASTGKLYYVYIERNGTNKITANDTTPPYKDPVYTLIDATSSVGRWTDIELDSTGKPVISYIDTSYMDTLRAAKVAYYDANVDAWEAMTDPAKYEARDQKTSVAANILEGAKGSISAKIAIGFNSSMYAVDFLRGEQ